MTTDGSAIGLIGIAFVVLTVLLWVPKNATFGGCLWRFTIAAVVVLAVLGMAVSSAVDPSMGLMSLQDGILLIGVGMLVAIVPIAKVLLGGVKSDDAEPMPIEGNARSFGWTIVFLGILFVCFAAAALAGVAQ